MSIENIKEENGGFDPFYDEPDRLITLFADEMRELGLEFCECDELYGLMPEKKEIIIPVALKYFRMAREEDNDEAQNYFLGFFEHKGLDEVVTMLIESYEDAHTWDATRWFIAECLYTIEMRGCVPEYIRVAKDRALGLSRQKVIALLGKIKDESAIPALVELLDDASVRAHTITALSEFENPDLRPHFERFKDDENPGVRKCAVEALERLVR